MASKPQFDHLFKVVLVGDSGVGKSNLLGRYTRNVFSEDTKSTIGVEFATRILEMEDGKKVKVQIWDTAGQERYRAITNAYYRGALGAVMVYDCTKTSTFENISRWHKELEDHANREIQMVLVGNKADLASDHREVSTEHVESLAKELNVDLFEASAKSGHNVDEAFHNLVLRIYEKTKQDTVSELAAQGLDVSKLQTNTDSSKCCN